MIAVLNYIPYTAHLAVPPRALTAPTNRKLPSSALSCGISGAMYQLAERTDILRAVTASGGDMVDYFVGDDEEAESGNGRR